MRAEGERVEPLSEPLWDSCPMCIQHFYREASGLLHAFASVGIEHGKSQFEMAETYFDQYHKVGHKDVIRAPQPPLARDTERSAQEC